MYALWQLSRVPSARTTKDRFDAGFSAVANGLLAASAYSVLFSSQTSSQAKSQQAWTARVMGDPGGRWLVGAVGVVVAVVGVVLAVRGAAPLVRRRPGLRRRGPAGRTHRARARRDRRRGARRGGDDGRRARPRGRVQYEPRKARGLDAALRTLRDTPVGPYLLVVVAAGLLAFGLYGLAEARYHET